MTIFQCLPSMLPDEKCVVLNSYHNYELSWLFLIDYSDPYRVLIRCVGDSGEPIGSIDKPVILQKLAVINAAF